MKTKEQWNKCLISDDVLHEIKGGTSGEISFVCPECGESKDFSQSPLLIHPTPIICNRCYCHFQVFFESGGYRVRILGKFKPFWK